MLTKVESQSHPLPCLPTFLGRSLAIEAFARFLANIRAAAIVPTIRPFITCDEKVKTIVAPKIRAHFFQKVAHITNGSNGAHNDTAENLGT